MHLVCVIAQALSAFRWGEDNSHEHNAEVKKAHGTLKEDVIPKLAISFERRYKEVKHS